MKMIKTFNYLVLLTLCTTSALAQNTTTAKIKTLANNGLQGIVLTPEFRGYAKYDLSNVRIYDASQHEVPYVISEQNESLPTTNFETYTTLNTTAVANKSTTLIIHKGATLKTDQLTLNIANTDGVKTYSLSGSNDKINWFGLCNKQQLYDLQSAVTTSVVKTIYFPLNEYKYVQLVLDDSTSLPINVLKIGYATQQSQATALQHVAVKSTTITQLSTEQKTRIAVTLNSTELINQIAFVVSNPTHYKRYARLYTNVTRKQKRRIITEQNEIARFELNSESKNNIQLPSLVATEFFIEIENNDNPPLTITTINYLQTPMTLIADLQAKVQYTLCTGDTLLNAPQYDLSYFTNTNHAAIPTTTLYDMQHTSAKVSGTGAVPIWQSKWFLWLCIGLGGVTLAYFAGSLVKVMKV
jgi:hypothetical protein